MGVYNPLAKMPHSCGDCVSCEGVYCPYLDDAYVGEFQKEKKKHPDCPLVEVKAPHGDLIDRTELIKKAVVIYDYNNYERLVVSDGALADAPTVLEAEGAK